MLISSPSSMSLTAITLSSPVSSLLMFLTELYNSLHDSLYDSLYDGLPHRVGAAGMIESGELVINPRHLPGLVNVYPVCPQNSETLERFLAENALRYDSLYDSLVTAWRHRRDSWLRMRSGIQANRCFRNSVTCTRSILVSLK